MRRPKMDQLAVRCSLVLWLYTLKMKASIYQVKEVQRIQNLRHLFDTCSLRDGTDNIIIHDSGAGAIHIIYGRHTHHLMTSFTTFHDVIQSCVSPYLCPCIAITRPAHLVVSQRFIDRCPAKM